MSCTLTIPIESILVSFDTEEGVKRELHPSIKCTHSLLVTPEGIRLTPFWGLQMFEGGLYELYLSENPEDSFYTKSVIFTGFYSTALKIVKFLELEPHQYTVE